MPHQPDEYEERTQIVTSLLEENLQVKARGSVSMVQCALLLLAVVGMVWFAVWIADEQPGWWPFGERELGEHLGVPSRR